MSLSDAAHLEQVRLARDAVIAGLADGSRVVTYTIHGREVTREPTNDLLKALREEVEYYERRINRQARNPFRLASLSRPVGKG